MRHRAQAILLALCLASLAPIAQAQVLGAVPPARPPTVGHELLLLVVGAFFGGLFAPLLALILARLGLHPGAADLHRIAGNLQRLVDMHQADREASGRAAADAALRRPEPLV